MDFEDKLREGSRKELDELKLFLFKENIRLQTLKTELEEKSQNLDRDRDQLQREVDSIKRKNDFERKRLREENRFFDKKLKILQNGFMQLQEDRFIFQKEVDRFQARKEAYQDTFVSGQHGDVSAVLFRGVNSHITLKKRYKDLMKIFHPDNLAGDQEMVQIINKEYDEIKKAYEVGRHARRAD